MASPSSSSDGPFALFGLVPRFDVDPAELERAFFERTRELHPDRFATAPTHERIAVLSRSRALNDAYQLLKREATRAEYLLARDGVTIGDNERIDPALVMELLEEREELAGARQAGDRARIEALGVGMRTRRTAVLGRVREMFAAAAPATEIKQQLILLRYVERYLEECDAALGDDD